MRFYEALHPTKPIALAELLGGERWSPDYFRPQYVANELTLEARDDMSTLGGFSKRLTCGPFGSSVPANLFVDSGVPFLRMSNVRSFYLDSSGLVCLPEDEADRLQAANFAPGDLVISKTGRTGLAAVLPPGPRRYVISQDVIGVTLHSGVSPYFVVAFLNSDYGALQFRRIEKGNVQAHLDLATTRAVRVPLPDRRIQSYIGAKVQLAELCRARSGSLRAEAIGHFDALLRTSKYGPGADLTNVVDVRALTDRLTGEFYLPRYYALEAHLAGLGVPVKPLRSLLRGNITRSSTPERDESALIPCILTSDIDPQEIRWRNPSLRITQSVHDHHSGRLGARDVVYTSVGPPVGEAAVVLPQFLPMAAGGDVSILRHGEDLHPGFLALYLNSVFGRMQNDRYSRGIRQRRVYPEDIGAFLIPVFGAKDQAYVGERIIRHQVLNELAVDLVNEAKANVEGLIEGALDVRAILSGTLKAPTADDIPELAEDGA
jgi:hypothetical protein